MIYFKLINTTTIVSMPAKVYSHAQHDDVVNAVGKHILKIQDESLKSSSTFKIAVSGGSLGKVLKQCLIDNSSIAPHIQWDKWEVYFSDERLVPLDHPDSNYGLFNEMVLSNLPTNTTKPKVNAIDESLLTGKDGQIASASQLHDESIAERYEASLPENAKFDLILLGCGPDGHTCSLFPDHRLLKERDELISAISDSPKPPPRRITFTFPVLERASSIAFVAEGAGKAPIMEKIFVDKSSQLPSKLVNELKTGVDVLWFVDDSAIEGVNVISSKY